jgi:hypothetical protein
MTLLDKIVSSGQNENLIKKRLGDYSHDATIKAKKIKKATSTKTPKNYTWEVITIRY